MKRALGHAEDYAWTKWDEKPFDQADGPMSKDHHDGPNGDEMSWRELDELG